jgi:hypothetical protein
LEIQGDDLGSLWAAYAAVGCVTLAGLTRDDPGPKRSEGTRGAL